MADMIVTTGDGQGLFHLAEDAVCPRVGEFITYNFTANNPDVWAKDSWEHNKKLDGVIWRVIRIDHYVHRSDWNKTRCVTWVQVKRIPAKRRERSGDLRE